MNDLNTISYELLESAYLNKDIVRYLKMWNKIKYNHSLLTESLEVIKNKENKNILKYPIIAESILINEDDVDPQSYDKLIDLIFSNDAIARTYISGKENGGFSFLLMALWNKKLQLTEEQKEFAVVEALKKLQEEKIHKSPLARELDIDKSKTAIVHGIEPYDIRYYILKSHNWSDLEKDRLVDMFWKNIEDFKEYIEVLEGELLSKLTNSAVRISPNLLNNVLYAYDYYDLLEITKDEFFTIELIEEITFCRKLHEMLEVKEAKKEIWWKM